MPNFYLDYTFSDGEEVKIFFEHDKDNQCPIARIAIPCSEKIDRIIATIHGSDCKQIFENLRILSLDFDSTWDYLRW